MSNQKPPNKKPPADASAAIVTRFSARHRPGQSRATRKSTLSSADEARLLASLREHIDQLPDINATRVVQLHNRIMSESYEIDPERVAEKLLQLELALED